MARFPRARNAGASLGSRDDERRGPNSAARHHGLHHLDVDVQRHRLDKEEQRRHLLDISGPQRCGEVEWDRLLQTRWQMELRSRTDDAGICTKRSPSLPLHKSFVQRNIGKSNWGKNSVHHNAEPQTTEKLLRTIIAVDQLSVHGAVAKWCNSKSPSPTSEPPSPTAEPQMEEGAGCEIPPQLVTYKAQNSGQWGWGKLRKMDE